MRIRHLFVLLPLAWNCAGLVFAGVVGEDPMPVELDDDDAVGEGAGEGAGEGESCEPKLVDQCWGDTAIHLECLTSGLCRPFNSRQLCAQILEALRCSSDIVDSACTLKDGRDNFDFWIRGLEAVHTKLCVDGLLTGLLGGHARCWDAGRFLHCAGSALKLEHVVDLLKTPTSKEECYAMTLTASSCAWEAKVPACTPSPVDNVNEILATFFGATECGCAAVRPGPSGPSCSGSSERVGVGALSPAPAPPPTSSPTVSSGALPGEPTPAPSRAVFTPTSAGNAVRAGQLGQLLVTILLFAAIR